MAKMQTAAPAAPVMDEAELAEMRRLIFDAPIAELAESQGISIDEAVKLRVEKNLEAAEVPIEVTVRQMCIRDRHGEVQRGCAGRRISEIPHYHGGGAGTPKTHRH